MGTTKKVLSSVLAVCMLASTGVVSSLAATTDKEAVSGSSIVADTAFSKANENLDADYAYTKGDLGATYTPQATTFKVWAPTAEKVVLNRYATGSDTEKGAAKLGTVELEKLMDGENWTGVWTATVKGDLKNTYYTYSITAATAMGLKKATRETQDVYSVATGVNGKRSMVCDLDSTDPKGWENDKHVLLDQNTDSTVWELHVKDFSYDPASGVSEANRGKYLAFTEEGTTLNGEGNISTCIDYLKDLGITTVQLNPFYDFQSVNEAGDNSQFNWGYDPQNYNVPEGSFSSNPYDGNVRITECKQMIQALHDAGISVVMDVVYNHTYNTDSCFQYTVPDYYYRLNKSGTFSDGSGCGNECATERAMYRDFFIQSLLYWVNEYHVDGFRFDLMGIMDVEAMNAARAALDTVDERITTWGEGWTGGDSYHPTKTCTGETFTAAVQGNASKLNSRVGIFNDVIRDGIKGGAMSISNLGFAEGNAASAKDIRYGLRAQTVGNYKWKATAPSQVVSYAACHDNATFYDQILGSTGLATYGTREKTAIKMNKLGAAIVYTAQGINFILAGEEMCRSKDGDTNSYKSPATENMIKWNNVVDYADVVSYYKGMMQIRQNFAPFTAMTTEYSGAYKFNNSMTATTSYIAYTVTNDKEDQWKKMAVIYNANSSEAKVTLADTSVTEWVVIANGQSAGVEKLGEVSGSTFTVPANEAVIAVDKESFEKVQIESNLGQVTVNYVYEVDGKKLDDSVVIKGEIGTKYQTSPSVAVPDTYVLNGVKGDTIAEFTAEPAEVTYYYVDYVPESIKNADINGDGKVDVNDVTTMLRYFSELETLTSDREALLDLNYDNAKNVKDVTMLQRALAEMPVSGGTVIVNHYYTNDKGQLQKLTATQNIVGRVGSDYKTEEFKIVGYGVAEEDYPQYASGKIPYGESREVNYYYTSASKEISLHFKHNGALTWAPTLWIWGSNLKGVDQGNYTGGATAVWPGLVATDKDADGWYKYDFTYAGAGTYNVIVSNDGANQTIDYKGFVDNEMWVVINDSAVSGGTYLTFYTDNPDKNPNAPIAKQITMG